MVSKHSVQPVNGASKMMSGYSGKNPDAGFGANGDPSAKGEIRRGGIDIGSFSDAADLQEEYARLQQEHEETMQEELERLYALIDDSSQTIRMMAEQLKPMKVETAAVPSALGLTINAASAKLKRSNLKIAAISQEYNERVPAGQVVSQIPGPGGRINKKSGVRIIISKGPPPEKERYDRIKKREKVPFLRIKSRFEKDDKETTTVDGVEVPGIPDGGGDIII